MSIRKLGIGGFATAISLAAIGAFAGVLTLGALPALADTAPAITINTPTTPTASTAHVSGTVNPNGGPSATTWTFEYAKEPVSEGWTPASGVTVSGEYPEGSAEATAITPQTVEGTIEGLQPNATYELRLIATNAGGEASPEPEVTAKTLAQAPTIDSESVTGVNEAEATLEALVNANNQDSTSYFQYSTSATVDGNGALIGATQVPPGAPGADLGEAFGDVPVGPDTVATLEPSTIYYYQVVATNATGTTYGPVQSPFTTTDTPIVTTGEAGEVTATTAWLSGGTVNPGGAATTYHYAYVEAARYRPGAGECPPALACAYAEGASTEAVPVGSDYTAHNTNRLQISELTPGTLYDYAVVATNSAGTTVGPDETFTTAPAPPPVVGPVQTAPPAPIVATLPNVTVSFPDLTGVFPLPAAKEPAVKPGKKPKKPAKKSRKKGKGKGKGKNKGKKASSKIHNSATGRK